MTRTTASDLTLVIGVGKVPVTRDQIVLWRKRVQAHHQRSPLVDPAEPDHRHPAAPHRREQTRRIDHRQHHDEQQDDGPGGNGRADLTASQQRAPPGWG